ncbi:hypothetical protein CZ794_07165 [Psychrobacter sp. JB385]|nr:hypothetical protein CZ794_07165 [Psychrobacter sp. JB385]
MSPRCEEAFFKSSTKPMPSLYRKADFFHYYISATLLEYGSDILS